MSFWTEERVERLRAMAANGYSASQAAYELGTTRNAVISVAHRRSVELGKGERDPSRPRAADPPRAPRKPLTPRRRGGLVLGRLKPIPAPPVQPIAPAPAAAPPGRHWCGLLELRNESCRWPVSGDGPPYEFCGTPEADVAKGMSYCPYHARMAYRGPGEREEAA